MKKCKECGIEKPECDFGIDRTMGDGLRAKCRVCRSIHAKAYFASLPESEKEKRREATRKWVKANPETYKNSYTKCQRKRRYGVDAIEFSRMLEAQGHKCAICGCEEATKTNGKDVDHLSVDHDHKTGRVRGLLCRPCNQGLGSFRDDPTIMNTAIAYLAKSAT